LGRYIKAAFWATPVIPGVGRIPANVIVLTALLVVGFVFPPLWLVAIVLELVYLYGLASNERFRQLVDAEEVQKSRGSLEDQRRALIASLVPPRQQRLRYAQNKCDKILEMQRSEGVEEFMIESNRWALERLTWNFLKLLVAQQNLITANHAGGTEAAVKQQIERLSAEIASGQLDATTLETKRASLALQEQKLSNAAGRAKSLEKIESNLIAIETKLDLALETALVHGAAEEFGDVNNAINQLLEGSMYGEASESVSALDMTYDKPAPQRQMGF
jgi:hypothetical protein